jgi:Leucine-rich repeat (LRR) protein
MKYLASLFVVVLSLIHATDAATKKMNIDTRRYAGICQHRSPITDNDKRGHAILKLVIESSSLSSVISKDSPHHKAMCWMIYDDPRKVDPRGNKAKFLERYALVTFYSNTKGPGWSRSDLWLSKDSECDWYGITCSKTSLFSFTPRVTSVDLSFNKVTGIIPPEIGYLTELVELDLNGNSLQGVLPSFMFKSLKKLKRLNLHMNDLFGAIPKEIGLLKNLKELTLFGNFFHGRVPAELGNLKRLENLDLYANNLTGQIPPSIGDLKKLKEFYVNDNELTGRMPKEICQRKLQHLVSDCLGARPEVPCECCTVCCQGLPDPKCRDMRAKATKNNK